MRLRLAGLCSVGLLQMRDLGIWKGSDDRLQAGHVRAVDREVVVRHAAAKNIGNQTRVPQPYISQNHPGYRVGGHILEACELRHLHNSFSDNLGALRPERDASNAAQARRRAK